MPFQIRLLPCIELYHYSLHLLLHAQFHLLADIKEMAEKTFVEVTTTDLFGASMMPIQNAKKPIIAAVSGYALGGGCLLYTSPSPRDQRGSRMPSSA